MGPSPCLTSIFRRGHALTSSTGGSHTHAPPQPAPGVGQAHGPLSTLKKGQARNGSLSLNVVQTHASTPDPGRDQSIAFRLVSGRGQAHVSPSAPFGSQAHAPRQFKIRGQARTMSRTPGRGQGHNYSPTPEKSLADALPVSGWGQTHALLPLKEGAKPPPAPELLEGAKPTPRLQLKIKAMS